MTSKVLGRGLAELGLDAILNEVDTQQSLGQLSIDSIDVDTPDDLELLRAVLCR